MHIAALKSALTHFFLIVNLLSVAACCGKMAILPPFVDRYFTFMQKCFKITDVKNILTAYQFFRGDYSGWGIFLRSSHNTDIISVFSTAKYSDLSSPICATFCCVLVYAIWKLYTLYNELSTRN